MRTNYDVPMFETERTTQLSPTQIEVGFRGVAMARAALDGASFPKGPQSGEAEATHEQLTLIDTDNKQTDGSAVNAGPLPAIADARDAIERARNPIIFDTDEHFDPFLRQVVMNDELGRTDGGRLVGVKHPEQLSNGTQTFIEFLTSDRFQGDRALLAASVASPEDKKKSQ